MNGVHDMGGMHGFGPVLREENEPVFHAAWEAHVRAMNEISQAYLHAYNIDEFRFGIEQMPPADYLASSYYKRWLATLEYNLILKGLITQDELDARTDLLRADPGAAPASPNADVTMVVELPEAECTVAEPPPARFAVGDAVETNNVHPYHHTRLPRYARGKRGSIHQVHGPATFPDTHAHGQGAQPHCLYNVRFEARELWGDSAEPGQYVHLDLWERYLSPAPQASPSPEAS
jgi:nitrile hydratase